MGHYRSEIDPTSIDPPSDIRTHSGSKYVRKVRSCITREVIGEIDCYSVADAFAVDEMPLNHALKKILCAGVRGKGNRMQDITEAIDALKEQLKIEGVREMESRNGKPPE